MKKITTKEMAYLGIYSAILIILNLVPQTGYISFGVIAFTIIPAMYPIATWHMGGKGTIVVAVMFSVGSVAASFYRPGVLVPLYHRHIELLLVPKILLGVFVYLFYKFVKLKNVYTFVTLTTLTFILNTALFVAMFSLITVYDSWADQYSAILPYIATYMAIEWAVGFFIAFPLYKLADHLMRNKSMNNSW